MITAQLETAADVLDELKPLFPKHWQEIGIYRDKMPLDPDYDKYLALENDGKLVLVTLRDDAIVVGYFVVYIADNLHYKSTPTAIMDIIYIDPERRGKKAGSALVKCMVKELRRRGISILHAGSKNHKAIEWLFQSEDFEMTETRWSMWLGD